MKYKTAIKLGDSYSKDRRGYLASSRIRGHWLAKYWPECDDYFYPEEYPELEDFFLPHNQFKILKDYDVVILNKTYEWKLVEILKKNRQIVIVDFCDPDFLLSHSSERRVRDCKKTLEFVDVAVVNGEAIWKELKKIYKGRIEMIPDRIDLEEYKLQKKEHRDKVEKIVWYGYNENLRVLEPYLKQIINSGLEIMIISDKFFENLNLIGCKFKPSERITFKVWRPETFNENVVSADVVFIGKDKDPYLSKFKSNNREMTAYAMGMPVAFNLTDLKKLATKEARIENVKCGVKRLREGFDIRHSVWQWDNLIQDLIKKKGIV